MVSDALEAMESLSESASYYDVLGVSKSAPDQDIRSAYKKLAIKYHPDKNPDEQTTAEANFKIVCQAYEVLSDAEKRQSYDRFGKKGLQGAGAAGGFSQQQAEEIFRQFFGGADPFEVLFGQMGLGAALPPGMKMEFRFVGGGGGMGGGMPGGMNGNGMGSGGLPPGVAEIMEQMMEERTAAVALAGPSSEELDEITTSDAAQALSEQYSKSVLATSVPPMGPEAMMMVLDHVRQLDNDRDKSGVLLVGHHRSKLLASGIVLHYQEFGSDSAPPVVLIHDVNDDRRSWDDVAAFVSKSFRVLAIDIRGHGETSRSPRKLYGLDDILGDLHDLVVELSLNGRDWDGKYTRAWALCGRGTGGAIATAYAARYPGRCSALMLIDYDPTWRKDHLAFSLFQAAHFASKEQAAGALNAIYGLNNHPMRIARALINRTVQVQVDAGGSYNEKGVDFRMDPGFFIHDLTTHNAESLLTSAARHTHIRIVHTRCGGGSHGAPKADGSPWGSKRAADLAAYLAGEGGAFDAMSVSLGDRMTSWDVEHEMIGKALTELAHLAGSDQARSKRAAALSKPPPPRKVVEDATPSLPAPEMSAELIELQGKGEDLKALGKLGREDRAALKARLKELGYKSMRVRVKMEEELCGLPPPR